MSLRVSRRCPYAWLWGPFQGQDGTESLWGKKDHESPSESAPSAHSISGGQEDSNFTSRRDWLPSPAARARCRMRGPQTSPEG